MAKVNEVCKDCLRWDKHGAECWVHWDLKKDCSLKATNEDHLQVPLNTIR